MPHWVEYEEFAEDLRKSWVLLYPKGAHSRAYTIRKVNVQVKYVYVETEEGLEPFRIQRDHKVKVLKPELTPQESFNQTLQAFVLHWKRDMINAQRDYTDHIEELANRVVGEDLLTFWELEGMAKQQTEFLFYAHKVAQILRYICKTEDKQKDLVQLAEVPTNDQWYEIMLAVHDLLMEEILMGHGHSTNSFSNAWNDLERDMQRQWLRQIRSQLQSLKKWEDKIPTPGSDAPAE